MNKSQKVLFNPRYDSLDHWRGLAALMVVLFHSFGEIRGVNLKVHPSMAWLKGISDYGWFGVHLFFVISGYCIAANVYRLAHSNRTTWNFFRDRLFRIYPTYWVACIVAVILNIVASPFNHVPLATNLPPDWKTAFTNVFLLEPYFHTQPLLLVSWTLVYEVGFYLLVACGYALWQRGLRLSFLFGLGVVLGISGLCGLHTGPFYVLGLWPEFVCGGGVFLCLWSKHNNGSHRMWWPMMVVAIFPLMVFALHKGQWISEMTGAFAFALILIFLHPFDAKIYGLKSLRWLAWVGTISYSLYLTHVIFMGKIINLFAKHIPSDGSLLFISQIAGWTAAICGAWMVYVIAERPLERWRHSMRSRASLPATKIIE